MDDHRRDRSIVWTPLFFSIVLTAGMILGFNLRETLRNKRDIGTVIQRNDRLEEIIDLVNDKYVDSINSNRLYNDAVNGILHSLDPHTIYIPADQLQGVNDDLEGGFSGIGVEFSILNDTIDVTSVIDDGPAHKAGIVTGDQLLMVGDSLVAGNGITPDRITHLLRGKQKTAVLLTLKQPDSSAIRRVEVVRDIVPLYSIDAAIMLDDATGYIKINRFSATTAKEFKAGLEKLVNRGAKQMIVDLRENPGGYLDAATSIADQFLSDNKLIVYTQGSRTPKTEYRAGDQGLFEKGRVAVLVDEGSASAAEILAGALQDWDRAVIVGRRTYGKGLVQEQYEMPDGAALRLTVAKYYTPSGRCIQRSFAKGKEEYQADYRHRFESGELTGNEAAYVADTTRYYTSKNRIVYGGGGIQPDVYVPYDTSKYPGAVIDLVFNNEFKNAVWEYYMHNRSELRYRDFSDFEQSFDDQAGIEAIYLSGMNAAKRKAVVKLLAGKNNRDYFDVQAKAQLARVMYKDNGYFTISMKADHMVGKAREILGSDQYLKLIEGKPGKP